MVSKIYIYFFVEVPLSKGWTKLKVKGGGRFGVLESGGGQEVLYYPSGLGEGAGN